MRREERSAHQRLEEAELAAIAILARQIAEPEGRQRQLARQLDIVPQKPVEDLR
jgi:hypothetical protein